MSSDKSSEDPAKKDQSPHGDEPPHNIRNNGESMTPVRVTADQRCERSERHKSDWPARAEHKFVLLAGNLLVRGPTVEGKAEEEGCAEENEKDKIEDVEDSGDDLESTELVW